MFLFRFRGKSCISDIFQIDILSIWFIIGFIKGKNAI